MQQQQIRQFREQILKMSREMWNRSDPKQVYVAADQSTPVQSSIDEKALIPYEQVRIFFRTTEKRSHSQQHIEQYLLPDKITRTTWKRIFCGC